MKYFYSHIIEIDTLYIELDELKLTDKEKQHLKNIIDTNLYHTILDSVLSELSEEEKGMFLEKLAEENHENTMEFLHKRILNIEDKVKRIAKDLMNELREDIAETKKR